MGNPVWGTCAGLIFLADKAIGKYLFLEFGTSASETVLNHASIMFYTF